MVENSISRVEEYVRAHEGATIDGIIGHTGLSEEKVGFAVKVLITIKRFTEEDGRYFHTGRTFRRTTEPDAPDGGDGQ